MTSAAIQFMHPDQLSYFSLWSPQGISITLNILSEGDTTLISLLFCRPFVWSTRQHRNRCR
jgi:hypothetical protein